MEALIKIEERENKKLVSARDLYDFLESRQKFSDWIKSRIQQFDFVEGEDFFVNLGKTPNGRPKTEYFLKLDMAKELSMLENNEKGKQARKYFIACEKQFKALPISSGRGGDIKQLTVIKMLVEEIENTQEKVQENTLELKILSEKVDNSITLESHQQYHLKKAINRRVMKRLEELNLEPGERRKMFSSIHGEIHKKFGVCSYRDIKKKDINLALNFIENWLENANFRLL
ncbi:antA/AntB antirepressor family protein [Cetobacterium sp.]|uniref:antA/AntB antirepressor family protein n=1 Tax=Cetobacterium sp. TaxID=2071632 RepID=UPI003F410640